MAAAAVYQPSTYDNLPMLPEASERYQAMDGDSMVEQFRALFLKHQVEFDFGLILNHRHFDMSANEQLVDYRGTSVPWTTLLDKVLPNSWALSAGGECQPYEFHYSPRTSDAEQRSPSDPKYGEFIKAFNELALQNGAAGLFGLGSYPGDDYEGRVEITAGRSNINLHPDDAPNHLASTPAAWYFSPVLYAKCTCICGGDGHTTATHKGHAGTR